MGVIWTKISFKIKIRWGSVKKYIIVSKIIFWFYFLIRFRLIQLCDCVFNSWSFFLFSRWICTSLSYFTQSPHFLTNWNTAHTHTHTPAHNTWWHWYNSYYQPLKVIPLIHTYTYARETLGGVKQYSENLGEFLRGDKIENSAYQVRRFWERQYRNIVHNMGIIHDYKYYWRNFEYCF